MFEPAVYFLDILFLLLIWKSQSKVEMIMLIFIFVYIVYYSVSLYSGIHIDLTHTNDTVENNTVFVMIIYVFLLGYIVQRLFRRKQIVPAFTLSPSGPINLAFELLISVLLVYELYLTNFDILRGVYGKDTKDSYFFEYINILFVLYIFMNRGRVNKKLLFFMFAHVFLAFSDGHRLMGLSTIMLIMAFYIYLVPRKLIPIFMLLGMVGLLVLGVYRAGLDVNFISLLGVRGDSFNNHHGSLIYSCLSIVDFARSQEYLDNVLMSLEYVLSLFGSKYWLPEDYMFTVQIADYTYRPGGGMLPVFFFAFFGFLGSFISGLYVSFVLSYGRQLDLNYPVPAFVLVAILLMPHYFSYTPILIFKAVLATFILESLLRLFWLEGRRK